MLAVLKNIKADAIYDNAIKQIKKRGFCNNLTYDPYTGEIDVWGAILLSCGAKQKLLKSGATEPEECGIPPYMCGRARFVCEYLEIFVGEEISMWCENHSKQEAISLLTYASDRVAITVLSP